MLPHPSRRAAALLALALLLALAPRTALAAWPRDPSKNLAVYTTTTVSRHAIVPDGSGGMFVVWQVDDAYPNAHVEAARVLADGTMPWHTSVTPSGLALQMLDACSDGLGGFVVAFQRDTVLYDHRVYAQRMNGSGIRQWGGNAVRVFPEQSSQSPYAIVSDNRGGALVVGWVNTSLRVQRVRSDGVPMFGPGGVTVVPPGSGSTSLVACSDDSAGVILAYYEYHSGPGWTGEAVRVHRFDGAGNRAWAAAGVVARDTAGTARRLAIGYDHDAGAYVAWADGRFGLDRAYVQRVGEDGVPGFGSHGRALDATQVRGAMALMRDPGLGVRVVWVANDGGGDHLRSEWVSRTGVPGPTTVVRGPAETNLSAPALVAGPAGSLLCVYASAPIATGIADLYALRMTTTGGTIQWGDPTPIAVCTATDDQQLHRACSDGDGGLYAVWQDHRAGVMGLAQLYAQRVTRAGIPGDLAPLIAYVNDVKPDQGGQIAIGWYPSGLDGPPLAEIGTYVLWRRVSAAPAVRAESPRERTVTRDGVTATWELVLQATASGNGSFYGAIIATHGDSVAGNPAVEVFQVEARAPGGATLYVSPPDSGYSVDNLAPASPGWLHGEFAEAGTSVRLTWPHDNAEPDFSLYHLYRGASAEFTPSPANRIAATKDSTWRDFPIPPLPAWYKLAAVDVHGNESAPLTIATTSFAGTEAPALPAALRLAAPAPNPARTDGATLRLDLPRAATVTLTLHDSQGRRVRTVATGALPAGTHALRWDGRDEAGRPVASGLYFVRLECEGRVLTRRLAAIH